MAYVLAIANLRALEKAVIDVSCTYIVKILKLLLLQADDGTNSNDVQGFFGGETLFDLETRV